MRKRTLGSSGLEVSTVGFGCMGLNYHRGVPPDRNEMIALLRKAVECGVTFFDTAEVYGPFTNESLVGEALEPFKGRVVIATKFGFDLGPGGSGGPNSRPDRIPHVAEESAEASAGRRHRPVLSAQGRSRRADRRGCRRRQGPDCGGQGQAFRSFRSGRPNH